jgi:DNA repair protein RAD50
MKVSKAILEHVVFVHQEESLWPLAESKPLKEKFDAIFAATKYTAAVAKIKELLKEKGQARPRLPALAVVCTGV